MSFRNRTDPELQKMQRAKRIRALKKNLTGYLFIAPNFLGFLVFILIPVVFSLIVSFSDWNLFQGLGGIRFIGFRNFAAILKDSTFIDSVKNNLLFTIGTIPVIIISALFIAVILNDKVYGKVAIRGMFFAPYISNIAAISVIWMLLYNPMHGPLNQFLRSLGISNPPQWLASTKWALPALMILTIWMTIGYNCVLYMAGLQGIPKELYESSSIDGANAFQKLWKITIPQLSPTTFFLLITNLISSFQVFGPVNIMTQGGPASSTSVISFYIYVSGMRYFKMGYAAAMAWFLMLGIFVVTLIQWHGQKKWVNYL